MTDNTEAYKALIAATRVLMANLPAASSHIAHDRRDAVRAALDLAPCDLGGPHNFSKNNRCSKCGEVLPMLVEMWKRRADLINNPPADLGAALRAATDNGFAIWNEGLETFYCAGPSSTAKPADIKGPFDGVAEAARDALKSLQPKALEAIGYNVYGSTEKGFYVVDPFEIEIGEALPLFLERDDSSRSHLTEADAWAFAARNFVARGGRLDSMTLTETADDA